jgi:hypothetical protein
MSISKAENLIGTAKQQISQRDINESLMRAMLELINEMKQVSEEVRRLRHDIRINRRLT